MPSRGSPNGARHTRPQPDRDGRDRPEQVVVIDWNDWSSSIGTGGRHHPVRAPLMQANRHVGIDLPMKVLVWEDDAGKVWIGYTPPSTLKARHKIDGRDDILKAMTGALEAFTSAAAN